jgi:hypothetical protein
MPMHVGHRHHLTRVLACEPAKTQCVLVDQIGSECKTHPRACSCCDGAGDSRCCMFGLLDICMNHMMARVMQICFGEHREHISEHVPPPTMLYAPTHFPQHSSNPRPHTSTPTTPTTLTNPPTIICAHHHVTIECCDVITRAYDHHTMHVYSAGQSRCMQARAALLNLDHHNPTNSPTPRHSTNPPDPSSALHHATGNVNTLGSRRASTG